MLLPADMVEMDTIGDRFGFSWLSAVPMGGHDHESCSTSSASTRDSRLMAVASLLTSSWLAFV